MIGTQIGIGAVNLAILVATRLAFQAWVERRLGYLEFDMMGTTGILWVPLVIVATITAVAGVSFPWVRALAVILTLMLAGIVVDHAIGAFRDGSVSPPGMLTGVLMGMQCVALGAGVAVGRRRGTGEAA